MVRAQCTASLRPKAAVQWTFNFKRRLIVPANSSFSQTKKVCTVTEIEMWLKEPVTLVMVTLVMVTLVIITLVTVTLVMVTLVMITLVMVTLVMVTLVMVTLVMVTLVMVYLG